MAKSTANLPVRLRKLAQARVKAAELARGAVLDAEPMRKLLGLSWPALKKWCADIPALEDKGAVVRGGNGIPWQFKPLRTIDLLTQHFEKERKASAAKAKRIRHIAMGPAAATIDEDLSLDDLAKMLKLQAQFREEREAQGRLVDAEQVRAAGQQYHIVTQQAILQGAQRIDPNGRLPPELRDTIETELRSILALVDQAQRDFLKAAGQG
jgi:hypothetical protein